MGLLNKLFGSDTKEKKQETAADKIVKVIREKTAMDFVRLLPVDEETELWNSKIGGIPYMPAGFIYPYDETEIVVKPEHPEKLGQVEVVRREESSVKAEETGQEEEPIKWDKKPLRFLGQLNFSEIPSLVGFPTTGILQFFISGENAYGLNFERRGEQKGFRIIYHERVTKDTSSLLSELPTDDVQWEEPFPVFGEMKLNFKKDSMAITDRDFHFEKLLLDTYNETHPELSVPSLDRVDESLLDEVYEKLDGPGHRVGGYPFFSQLDPREYDEAFKTHTRLLFQLDSDGDDGISWGDSGVCNFFIRPEDLDRRDFSNVLYNWDCY